MPFWPGSLPTSTHVLLLHVSDDTNVMLSNFGYVYEDWFKGARLAKAPVIKQLTHRTSMINRSSYVGVFPKLLVST